jgi:hypothetical protein
MPRSKRGKKNQFISDEAEHSGNEEGDEYYEDEENEYDFGDIFIDDEPITNAPPPIFLPPLILHDELSIHTLPPLSPPPPPVPTPGAPGPPPPPPAKKPASDWIRPKSNRDKRMCQIVQQALMPAVAVGYLTHVLVTIIPDYKEKLEDAWTAVRERLALLVELANGLHGLFGFFIALETHGAATDKKKKRKNPNPEDAAHQAEQQGADAEPAKKDSLAGKPHFHVLLYYPKFGTEVWNLSRYKNLIMERLGNSDVNEVKLPKRGESEAHFVRACTYVLKGVNCPATRRYWQRHVNPASVPPLPAFYSGATFAETKEESCRFANLLKQLPTYCEAHVPLRIAEARPAFGRPVNRSKSSQSSYQLSEVMREHGIYVGGNEDNVFYVLDRQENYVVKATYVATYSLHELKRFLTGFPVAREIVHNYFDAMNKWFVCMEYQHIPKLQYTWIELLDAYYEITSGKYVAKDQPFDGMCFRSYSYSRAQLEAAEPTEWLELISHITSKKPLISIRDPTPHDPNNVRVTRWSDAPDKDLLLKHLARLLRMRYPKQPIPFLWGKSRCGKSTVISFLQQLYPKEAVGFLNKSCVSLAGISEDIAVIVADEFDVTTIPRSDLLILCDGSQLLQVRKMHQDPRLMKNPMCPMVFTDNFAPKYKGDDSQALEGRFDMIHCENKLEVSYEEGRRKQALVFSEHLFIVRYLNDYLLTHP